MNSRNILYIAVSFVFYILIQVMFFKSLVLFDVAFCFVYIAFVLMLPVQISTVSLILAGFASGLVIDVFYDSLGINAAAITFIAFLRPVWMRMIPPRVGYEDVNLPTLKTFGFTWFMAYSLPLIFIHHMIIFFMEAGGVFMFLFTMSKVISSTIFTFFIVVLAQYMFYKASE